MKTKDGHEWFTLNLKFDVAAPNQAAAQTKGLRISSELVERYDLNREPIVKVQPAREAIPA
jgi:hypothetical protein